ncbi:MAG: peptidoglycan DD-metalloendopeptidase family protein [Candidatus Margulisbacteria bacterium]|nr:peptidoglycan DD-metalloendopeptidase family protein [Candidatus Margulisiibacteriota bacterium]
MKLWTGALVLLLLGSQVLAEDLTEQERLQAIQNELKQSQAKLQETKKKRQNELGKLVEITQELRQANRRLNKAKEKINENVTKISELSVELKKNEADLEHKSSLLEQRVRESFKNGRISYLDLLFASRSMSDFLNRAYYFEKVVARDASLIRNVRQELRETKEKRTDLNIRTREIKQLTSVIAEQKVKISTQAEEKKKVLSELQERQAEYENKIAELERSSRELEILIQQKVTEREKTGSVARGSGAMIWPLQGRITSRYGTYRRWGRARHTGIDIAATYGSPVMAADSGEVIFAGWWDGYGKAIVIDHGKGIATVYGHLSRIYPSVGMTIAKGQTIGLEGNTGYSTGPHLHFEVRKNGKPVNPGPYLPKR